MSYCQTTYHIVFSTHNRQNTIDERHERELYKVIYNIITRKDGKVWRIGGMSDHVHILCDIPVKYAVSDFVRNLKSETSKFLRENPKFPYWDKWSEGYGCFTVSAECLEVRIEYIKNQKEHHKKMSFFEEFKNIFDR